MHTILLIIFMIVIGAFIGGLTNFLAIKMLFRPYNVVKIGSWRLPFTPGLIPRRRDEIAAQLGKMVVNHLLTADGLTKRVTSAHYTKEVTGWLQQRTKEILHSTASISELLEKHFGIKEVRELARHKTESFINEKYDSLVLQRKEERIEDVLPIELQEKITEQIPHVTAYLLERGEHFIQSPEGKERLSTMIERFLDQKGKIGSMIQMFLGQERLVDKVQPELIKFFRDEGTNEMVENVLRKEWNHIRAKKVGDLVTYIKEEELIKMITFYIDEQVPVYKMLDTPLCHWTGRYEKLIIDSFVPNVVTAALATLMTYLQPLLKSLQLENIVYDEVRAFSLERLEELVISIARRELKMITYLGAVLGGVIGLIQGFIVILTG